LFHVGSGQSLALLTILELGFVADQSADGTLFERSPLWMYSPAERWQLRWGNAALASAQSLS
jgi:hypothetical protein